LRAEIAQSRMQATTIVDLVDEGHRIDRLDLECLYEAYGPSVVVRVASPSYRTDEAVAKLGFPLGLSGVLRTADVLLVVKRRFGWR
jgi:hypothetical protein